MAPSAPTPNPHPQPQHTQTSTQTSRTTLASIAALSEAILLTSAFTAFSGPLAGLGVAVLLIGIWAALFLIAQIRHGLASSGLPMPRVHAAMIVLFIAVVLAIWSVHGQGIDNLLVALAYALLIWGAGVHLGGSDLTAPFARQVFWFSAIVISISTLLHPTLPRVALLMACVPVGLLGVQVALRRQIAQHHDMSARALATPRWRSTTALILLATTALVIVDTALLNSAVMAFIIRALILIVALPVSFIIYQLALLLVNLLPVGFLAESLQRLSTLLQNLQTLGQQAEELQAPAQASQTWFDPRWLFYLAVLLIVALIVYALARSVRRDRRKLAPDDDDVWPTDAPSTDKDQDDDAGAGWRKMPFFSRWFAAATIRVIYARMVAEAARRGYARNRSQTPREFLPTLAQAFPGAAADVDSVTHAYEAAHYGALPDTLEKLNAIKAAWDRARKTRIRSEEIRDEG